MTKKRHHYIPQFYLKGFVDPNTSKEQTPYLWVGDIGEKRIFRKAPTNVARLHGYYTITRPTEVENQDFEDYLATKEAKAAPVLERLITASDSLSDSERRLFSEFVTVQKYRVPCFREKVHELLEDVARTTMRMMASDPKRWQRKITELEKETGVKVGAETESLRQFTLSNGYDIKASPNMSLGIMLKLINTIAPIINEMRWAVFSTPIGQNLLTSDCPVSLYDPTTRPLLMGVGLGMEKVELILPLTRHAFLFATWNGPTGHGVATSKNIDQVNYRTTESARRYLFGPDEGLVKQFLEFRK